MKQKLLKSILLLCALVVGSSNVWAETKSVDITPTQALNEGGVDPITITCAKGDGTSNPAISSSQLRLYQAASGKTTGNTITFSSEKTISSIVFTFANSMTATNGSFSAGTYDNETFTWTGSTKSVTLTVTGTTSGTRIYITAMKVYYEEEITGSPSSATFAETTPSINFPATTTYSQTATTAAGYSGTVTYEITANTAGASITGSTVTVTQEGSVTVKATAPAITGWAKSEATYTLTITDTRTDNGLGYEDDSQEVIVSEVLSAPTLTNPNGLAITYASADEDIATVDASGNVTGVAVGSTTITASFAGDETYKAGSVSYTITVKKAPVSPTDGVFDFTYADEIDYGTGLTPSSTDIKETKTFTAGNVTLTPEPTATNKYWRWWTDGTLRLYTDTKMTISVSSDYYITNIAFTGTQNLDAITVSSGEYEAAGDKKSATWTGLAKSITFTRGSSNPFFTNVTVTYIDASVPATISTAEYATFSSPYPTDFSTTGITVYTAIDNENSVTLNEVASGQVPANTPVVLYKAGADGSAIDVPVIASADAIGGTNDLHVSTGTDVENMYVLAKKTAGVGFYPWAGTTDLSAGKIYLQGKASYGAREFLGFANGSATTAINNAQFTNTNEANTPVYNLNGQRVAQPTRGLYIVNGKKVVVK